MFRFKDVLNRQFSSPPYMHGTLRMFARKSSNIDFFIKLLLQLGYELFLSKKPKKGGGGGGHRRRFGNKIF